jgi:hypothetical protein
MIAQQERIGRGDMSFQAATTIESSGIVFDIETVALPGVAEKFNPEKVAMGNIKDPDKIEAKLESARESFIESAALSPVYSRIVSIGFYGNGFKIPAIKTARNVEDEERLLAEFFHIYSSNRDAQIVGFRSLSFDLPFVYHRARVHRMVQMKELPWPMSRNRSVDLHKELTFGLYWDSIGKLWPDSSLAGMAENFDVRSSKRDNQCDGKDYGEYVLSEDVSKVEKAHNHLYADLEETFSLYKIK